MKIFVVEFAGRGGLMHYTFQLCRAMAEEGADVTLVTGQHYELSELEHPFRLVKLLRLWDPKPAAVSTSRVARPLHKLRRIGRAARYYREWLRLVAYLRQERPDVVQFGDIRFPGDLPFLRVLRALGLRLSDVCHNVHPFALGGRTAGTFSRSRLNLLLFRRIYQQFERVFVHYEVNRRLFLEAYGVDESRVVEVPHGNEALFEELADPSVTADGLRRALGLDAEARVVLFFGTLARYKGVDVLIEAFGEVHRQEPRARLVLAGFPSTGFDVSSHLVSAERAGVTSSVHVVPRYIDSGEVAAWMRLATVAAFPYREVYQSGALLVAQTLGVPGVATSVGAFPEMIDDGRTGLLVPPEDPSALSAALLSVLRDPDGATRMGAEARRDALGRYGWHRIASTFLEEYRRLGGRGLQAAPIHEEVTP
jgi:glycosyltransferase involved in cell wall biosynthesis